MMAVTLFASASSSARVAWRAKPFVEGSARRTQRLRYPTQLGRQLRLPFHEGRELAVLLLPVEARELLGFEDVELPDRERLPHLRGGQLPDAEFALRIPDRLSRHLCGPSDRADQCANLAVEPNAFERRSPPGARGLLFVHLDEPGERTHLVVSLPAEVLFEASCSAMRSSASMIFAST